MENKQKHLEFIQAVINRMANTSFLIKGWTITLASGLLGVGLKENIRTFLYLNLFVAVIFWVLDAYYMRQERLFRVLYDEVRQKPDEQVDFSMHTKHIRHHCSILTAMLSRTVLFFYAAIIICTIIFIYH